MRSVRFFQVAMVLLAVLLALVVFGGGNNAELNPKLDSLNEQMDEWEQNSEVDDEEWKSNAYQQGD